MTTSTDWQESELRTRWERLGAEDVARIAGDRERLLACLVDLYGWTHEEAETEVAAWERHDGDGATDAPPECDADSVAQASADSFPASDPPGWIKQAPRAPKQASAPPKSGAEQPAHLKTSRARKQRT